MTNLETQDTKYDAAHVNALLDKLDANEAQDRREARRRLVALGEDALGPMLERLVTDTFGIRWEIAKALGEMRLPGAVPGLIAALEDNEQDVRWLAAVGLARTGRPALRPLLEKLVDQVDSPYVRQGTSYFLSIYRDPDLAEDLSHLHDNLGSVHDEAEAIVAAEKILARIA